MNATETSEVGTVKENRIRIDGEIYTVKNVATGCYLPIVETYEGPDFYVAEDSEKAGNAARRYWEDLAQDDPEEFACIIGTERLIKWGMGQSDEYGIHDMHEFFDAVEKVPEEEFASYDGSEREVNRAGRVCDELDFTPTVAYRHN